MIPAMALLAGSAAADKPPQPDEPIEQGLLEFLAEEPALDEELNDALMSNDLDREIERSTRRREVQGDAKNEG